MKDWTDPNQIFTQISLLNSKDKYWVKFLFRGQRSRSRIKHLFLGSLVTYETLIIYQPNFHTGNMPLKQLKRVGQLFILELKVKVTGQTFHHSWNLNNFRKTEPISTKSSHKKHVYTTMKNSGPYFFLGSKVKVTGHTGLNFLKLHEFIKTENISAESSHKEHVNKMIEKQGVYKSSFRGQSSRSNNWKFNNFWKTEPISTKCSHKKCVYTTSKTSGLNTFSGVKGQGHGSNCWKWTYIDEFWQRYSMIQATMELSV